MGIVGESLGGHPDRPCIENSSQPDRVRGGGCEEDRLADAATFHLHVETRTADSQHDRAAGGIRLDEEVSALRADSWRRAQHVAGRDIAAVELSSAREARLRDAD